MEFNVDTLKHQLARTDKQVRENTVGIAIANALSGSTWLQANENVAFTANVGYFDGSSAVAFSGATRISEKISANAAIGVDPDGGKVGARAGVRLGW